MVAPTGDVDRRDPSRPRRRILHPFDETMPHREIAVELEIGEHEEIRPEHLVVVTHLAKHIARGTRTERPPRGARDIAAERAPAPAATAPRQHRHDPLRITLP